MTEIKPYVSNANASESFSAFSTIDAPTFEVNANRLAVCRISGVASTERIGKCRDIELSYARYNKNKRDTYKQCTCRSDNSRKFKGDPTLSVTGLEVPETNSDTLQKRWQRYFQRLFAPTSSNVIQNARYYLNNGKADVCGSKVQRTQHSSNGRIKSGSFPQNYQILEMTAPTTVYCKKTTSEFSIHDNCSFDSLYEFENSIQNDTITASNHIYANEVSSADFHRILMVTSALRVDNKRPKGINSLNSRKNRTSFRSNIVNGSGLLNCQIYGNTMQYILLILLLSLSQLRWTHALLVVEPKYAGLADDDFLSDSANNNPYMNDSIAGSTNNRISLKSSSGRAAGVSENSGANNGMSSGVSGYMDKLNNLERNVAAVLIKVAYGTTSTTKRSIPDNSYVPSLTTIATPLLTTLRYAEKSSHQQQINLHHRNYELDLERDHALPTSAPNADILKSNSNPTYPNPNRHHTHERERHRHVINSTTLPSLPHILKINGQLPTIPVYPGDIPSYSPPARSFFTPPLPPEYQNPFADKPTLRGTNNEGIVSSTGTYINRRPIPPPSLMPGHERIPFRPPDLAASTGGNSQDGFFAVVSNSDGGSVTNIPVGTNVEAERKKALNTPSLNSDGYVNPNAGISNIGVVIQTVASDNNKNFYDSASSQEAPTQHNNSPQEHSSRQEVLPSIRRILSGSNGNKGEIPQVLLKQAPSRPFVNYNQPPSSPVVLLDGGNAAQQVEGSEEDGILGSSNINKSKNTPAVRSGTEIYDVTRTEVIESKFLANSNVYGNHSYGGVNDSSNGATHAISSTPAAAAAIGGELGAAAAAASATSTSTTVRSATIAKSTTLSATVTSGNIGSGAGSSTSSSTAAAASSHSTWAVAWNIHVYFSVVLFTILAVYSLYKVFTYNKLTHLFSQSYFMCIHLVLIVISSARIFYLCYDAYNIHATFNLFVSELLLNLPATLLTISFSVLVLYLFLKALNHKNNRYSALIRPLTVVVGCGVHVVLCITLHYVESYTLQNQQQQQLLYQQQQQQLLYRRQQQQQQLLYQHHHQLQQQQFIAAATTNLLISANSPDDHTALFFQAATSTAASAVSGTLAPRVLSLICQIIYIFVCLFLGLLYLYLYRILKRILRSKSQNYIHGYQNLSYAIHITIATALLFVLLAALQIFGAISISTTRPLIQQLTSEIDWLQWGYQFSLRLIEIALIILLSWVAGLKTSGGGGGGSGGATVTSTGNGDARYGLASSNGGGNVVFGSGTSNHNRDKYAHHHFHHNHSNVTGFFLPCTSSSSQEQFETDYPAVCNANTNLHTYTMRTGKLIYDDSFALNSLSGNGQSQLAAVSNSAMPTGFGSNRNPGEFQFQTQPTYQRPYDSGSLNSVTANRNPSEYGTQSTLAGGAGRYCHEAPQYADYLTDTTTDHYENPNFDLCGSVSGSGFGVVPANPSGVQKFTKTSTTSTTASSSGGSGSSAASQQQMLLLQSDSCYSEPLQPPHTSNYDLKTFERPYLASAVVVPPPDFWSESQVSGQPLSGVVDNHKSKSEKKMHSTLDRSAYENSERRSSNSTHSCASSTSRYGGYNSFDRSMYNGVRKSGTSNNIVGSGSPHVPGLGIVHGRNSSSSSGASSNVSAQRTSGVQTLALTSERHHQPQRSVHGHGTGVVRDRDDDRDRDREHELLFSRSSIDRSNTKQQNNAQHQQQNSDDDMMLTGSNVERTNLIDNEDGSCIANSKSTISFCGGRSQLNEANVPHSNTSDHLFNKRNMKNSKHFTSSISNPSGTSITASESNRGNSTAVLVAEHGFVRFRAIDDMNNAQGIGIHNASIRN